VDVLDHPVPYETVQPEIRGAFHLDEFDPSPVAIHPPYVAEFNRQRLVLIGEQKAQRDVLVCQQWLIGFDRASYGGKIRDRPFADRRHRTVHRRVDDWQAVEASMVGSDLFHRGA
jgi:hypothetical protein